MITENAQEEGGAGSNHTHHSFLLLVYRAPSSKANLRALVTPSFLLGPPRPLSTPLLMLGSFQRWVVMKSWPSDVCCSLAGGHVDQATEQEKASPLQTG